MDSVFEGGVPYEGLSVLLATYAFAFQIFCDFAGYSNIARGVAKCMGFNFSNQRLHCWHLSALFVGGSSVLSILFSFQI